jgi:predicted hydrolase (HD superfamily)
MKDKAFAAAVNRDDIIRGAEELEIALEEHIELVINAMKKIAEKLGL